MMRVTINPITQQLKEIVDKYGAEGWTVLRNDQKCKEKANKFASLVSKGNKLVWLSLQEMIMEDNEGKS